MEGRSNKGNDEGMVHIVAIPWFARGHMLPMLDLCTALSVRGHKVTVLSTPGNISTIKTLLPQGHLLDFSEVPMPAIEGLPIGKENTRDLEESQVPKLIAAMKALYEPLKAHLTQISPDCVISDVIVPPAPHDLGIPSIFFVLTTGAFSSYKWYLDDDVNCDKNPIFKDRRFIKDMAPFLAQITPFVETGMANSCAMLLDSCMEMERECIQDLEEKSQMPVFAVGPLLSPARSVSKSGLDNKCKEWLELQPQGSVLYIGFGTECSVSDQQCEEICSGLEASAVPFIWALGRCKIQHDFEERIDGKQGIILRGWVPQFEILSNDKVGGIMSHCGLNAVKEAVTIGLSIVAVPMQYEQKFSARFVCTVLKTGVQVEVGCDGLYGRESICRTLKRVMAEDEGLRKRVRDLARVLSSQVLEAGGSRDKEIDRFLRFVLSVPKRP